jgi:hypothetical protein
MDGSMSVQPIQNPLILGGVHQLIIITAPTNWLMLLLIVVPELYHNIVHFV